MQLMGSAGKDTEGFLRCLVVRYVIKLTEERFSMGLSVRYDIKFQQTVKFVQGIIFLFVCA